jgi:hypothetical protein
MQDISSTTLATAPGKRAGRCKVYVRWDGVNWTEETAYLTAPNGTLRATDERSGIAAVGHSVANTATVYLNNQSGRFSPWNSSSAIYAYIADGAWQGTPARVELGYLNASGDFEGVYVMKGHIAGYIATPAGSAVTLSILDKLGHYYDGNQIRTILYTNQRTDQLADMVKDTAIGEAGAVSLDRGIFTVPWFWADEDDALALISKLAAAEGGRAYYSPSGAAAVTSPLVFENATHLLTADHATAVDAFDLANTQGMVVEPLRQDRRNHIRVTYTPMHVGRLQELWSAPETHRVNAGDTITVKATFNMPAYYVCTGANEFRENIDYIAVTAGQQRKTSDITVTFGTAYAKQRELTIENTGALDLYLVRLRLMGYPIEKGDQETVEVWVDDDGEEHDSPAGVSVAGGWRTLEVSQNECIQTREHARALARALGQRMYKPVMGLHLSNLAGRPWLEIGDRVGVSCILASQQVITSNAGFETAGEGGADVVAAWSEDASNGAIALDTSTFHGGAKSLKLTAGAALATRVYRPIVVTAGQVGKLSIWTRGDGTNAGRFSVFDVTNNGFITAATTTNVAGAGWRRMRHQFTVPTGCEAIVLSLWCPAVNGGYCYFDDVSLTFSGMDNDYFIQAIPWRFVPPAGLSMDLTLLPADGLFPFSDYFVLGTSTLGVESAGKGRYWY